MKYITQIKAFQDVVQDKQLSTGQIALYHALLYINNRCSWTEWFSVANLSLSLNSGLSRSGVLKSRNILKQLNLIDFKCCGIKATQYKIIDLEKAMLESTQDSTHSSNHSSTHSSNHSSTHSSSTLIDKTRLDKTRLDNILDTPIVPKDEPNDIFNEFANGNSELLTALEDFVKMRKAIKNPMTDRAKRILVNKLLELSPKQDIQIKLLEKAILRNWKSVYALDENEMQMATVHHVDEAVCQPTAEEIKSKTVKELFCE